MLALGFLTRYGGTDATLGLAFTKTGGLYPFFAAFLGWLGVALTGSDTSSNVLFGSLQKITAQQLGFTGTARIGAGGRALVEACGSGQHPQRARPHRECAGRGRAVPTS